MGVRQKADMVAEDYKLLVVNQARAKWFDRWVEYTHEVEPDFPAGEYDLSIPEIHIEWMLCDPYNLRIIKSKKHRHEFYEKLTPVELDVYLNRADEGGHRYCDLEKGSWARAVARGVRESRRK